VFDGVRFSVSPPLTDPGDMLLLVHDGLTESCNSSGEEYGFRRIKRVAAQHLTNDTFEADFGVSLRLPQLPIGSKQVDDFDAASDSQDGLTTG